MEADRLRRSRRSFATPSCSVAKRLCVDDEGDDDDSVDDERQRKTRSDGPQVAADPRDLAPKPPSDGGNVEGNGSKVQSGTAEGGGGGGGGGGVGGAGGGDGGGGEPRSPAEVLALRDRLRRQLRDRAEVLRRLHMNDLSRLQTLIDKWRGCAQAALYQLQTELPADGHKASLAQLLDHLGLDHKILHFDHAEDDFTD
ncbi:hypothetical protein CRUP_000217 [Coryphaenoides rupestris]|nr:hypothetical protein CRUP_000217 [Coryphaenoides rupestris]